MATMFVLVRVLHLDFSFLQTRGFGALMGFLKLCFMDYG